MTAISKIYGSVIEKGSNQSSTQTHFLFCLSTDADVLQPPEPEKEEEFVPEVVKTPETKHWESFGSCLEIEEESVKVKTEKVQTQSNTNRISVFSVFMLVSLFNKRQLCVLILSAMYL